MTDIQSTYNYIAKEFSDSRYRVWKGVAKFLDSIELNTINADIGCRNGKNMKYITDKSFDRFYHVYVFGELEGEIKQNKNVYIEEVNYELSNHYVIIKKLYL
jgi:hypothetical protein